MGAKQAIIKRSDLHSEGVENNRIRVCIRLMNNISRNGRVHMPTKATTNRMNERPTDRPTDRRTLC